MAIVAKHVLTNKRYIIVGPAYGFAKTNRNNLGFETRFLTSEEKLMVGCDASGEIHWINANELVIESVDGMSCREVLSQRGVSEEP